jgi:5-(carboxyamino)imidazole ribonucleotide synthase
VAIGVLGAGQLGRMLALAGYPLGLEFAFYDKPVNAPAAHLGQYFSSCQQGDALAQFLAVAGVVTYETENVPLSLAEQIAKHKRLYPGIQSLRLGQNRIAEKKLFKQLNIPTPAYQEVHNEAELKAAVADIGLPAVLKTVTLGYDGKGQILLKEEADLARAWQKLQGDPLVVEAFVYYQREVSIIGVRNRESEMAFYPVTENYHHQGILRYSLAPAPALLGAIADQARQYMAVLLTHLNHIGVLALELFETEQGLLANEMAPRVHNSGHWTINGAVTSQFENHLRAIAGLPLGSTALCQPYAAMVNIIGSYGNTRAVLAIPGAHLHCYGKEARPGRKIGHINLTAQTEQQQQALMRQLAAYLPPSAPVLA